MTFVCQKSTSCSRPTRFGPFLVVEPKESTFSFWVLWATEEFITLVSIYVVESNHSIAKSVGLWSSSAALIRVVQIPTLHDLFSDPK